MKNKYKHGKAIAVTTMAIAAVSLVTVGFSTWVISAVTKDKTGNISVTVGKVEDQIVPITLLGTNGLTADNSIKFDGITDDQGDIVCDSDLEDMTFGITFKIDKTNGFKGIKVAATEAMKETYLTTWAEATYIKLPFKLEKTDNDPSAGTFIPLIDKTWVSVGTHYITYDADFIHNTVNPSDDPKGGYDVKVEVSASDNIITYVCTFNFHWGAKFNSKNPVEEANTQLKTSDVKNALIEMQHSTAFNLTVQHDPAVEVTVATPKQ